MRQHSPQTAPRPPRHGARASDSIALGATDVLHDAIEAFLAGAGEVQNEGANDRGHPGLELLQLLAGEDGQPLNRIARALRMSLADMQPLLAVLGRDETGNGLDLVTLTPDGHRLRVWLTRQGRLLCSFH